MLDDGGPLLFVFIGRDGIGAADCGIHRSDERRAVEHDHLVDELGHVIQPGLLVFGRSAEIAVRSHASANGTANEFMFVEFAFYMGGIDVGRVFDGDFDGVETPAFELRKKFSALVSKG